MMNTSGGRMIGRSLVVAVTLLACGSVAPAADALKEALTGGTVNVDLRYRFELVDQDGFVEDAEASTIRLRLGYTTDRFHGLFAGFEFEDVELIGSKRYNSDPMALSDFPLVADPEDEEVNQMFIGYAPIDAVTMKLGRQRITLDNHRFIGNVGWRQNEQTFDGFKAEFDFGDDFSLVVGYLNNANTVWGEHHPDPSRSDIGLSAPLVNVSYTFPAGKLTGYAYLLELDETPLASNQSIGVRFAGSHKFTDSFRILYTGEYADQSDYADGAPTIDASYLFGEAGVGVKKFTGKVGYELLEGDGFYAFQTPFATLHAFNGWADKFLVTPADGLEDFYLSAEATVRGIKLLGVYHDFGADATGADYGTEIDLLVGKTFKETYTIALKYASYDADTFSVDTDKLWMTLQLKF